MSKEEDFARFLIEQQIQDERKSPIDTWEKGLCKGWASASKTYAQIYCSRCGLSYDELYNDEKSKFEGVAV